MEYQNIIMFILIFIISMAIFYFIISNFGINTKLNDTQPMVDELQKKVSDLNNQLINIKISQLEQLHKFNKLPSEINTVKEIIIENEQPIINMRHNPELASLSSNVPSDSLSNSNLILPTSGARVGTGTGTETGFEQTKCNRNKPPPIVFDPIANYDIAKLTDPLVDPRGRTSADQIPTPQVAAQFNFPTQGVLDRYHRVGLLIAIGSNKNLDENVWDGNIKKSKKKRRYVEPNTNSETKSYRGVEIKESFDSLIDTDDLDNLTNSNNFETNDSFDSIEEFKSNIYSPNPNSNSNSNSNSNFNTKKIVNVYNNFSDQNDNSILELIGKKITDNWYKYFTSITMGNKIIKVVVRNKNRKELYSGDIVFIPEIGKKYRVKIDPMDMIEYNPYMF